MGVNRGECPTATCSDPMLNFLLLNKSTDIVNLLSGNKLIHQYRIYTENWIELWPCESESVNQWQYLALISWLTLFQWHFSRQLCQSTLSFAQFPFRSQRQSQIAREIPLEELCFNEVHCLTTHCDFCCALWLSSLPIQFGAAGVESVWAYDKRHRLRLILCLPANSAWLWSALGEY